MAAQPGVLQGAWWLEPVAESPLSLSWWVGSRVPEEDTASCTFLGPYFLQLGPASNLSQPSSAESNYWVTAGESNSQKCLLCPPKGALLTPFLPSSSFFLESFCFYYHVCTHAPVSVEDQKRVLDPLKLKLKAVVSCPT